MRSDQDHSKDYLFQIASEFFPKHNILHIDELSSGNINKTFLVKLVESETDIAFILQQINSSIFDKPSIVMNNWQIMCEHIHKKTNFDPYFFSPFRWEVPMILPRLRSSNSLFYLNKGYWRAIKYIKSSKNFDLISSSNQAKNIGVGLARFHSLISDLPVERISPPLTNFHNTPYHLSKYDLALQVFTDNPVDTSLKYSKFPQLNSFIDSFRSEVSFFDNAILNGDLVNHLIHGDPKISNFMFDLSGQEVIALIDLDTVQPGLLIHDLSDCLRSCCNPFGEDSENLSDAFFDLKLCEAILLGYVSINKNSLSYFDIYYLPYCIRLMPFELGLRFLTDYLSGNVYFSIDYSEHNLHRAQVQFRIVQSIDQQWASLVSMIHRIIRSV